MSSEMLQALLVPLIVGLAALSIGVRTYRAVVVARRKSDSGCGGGCCGTK